ncbi:peptide-methionine (S)-S-oxide reductase MsrA [Capnocytophaga canimorsus]|uniref:peptide-methionine (S)-S-oxide reductase MsrA n=1 Tax=Capnocytophaga canimorsus TaxID=28188 RepID=UPI0037D41BD6
MLSVNENITEKYKTATFGAGCFWCVEAIFGLLKGVIHVKSGYTGGHTPNPTYEEVCDGVTGHAEVVQITYDPNVISFENLLAVFWNIHNPTTLNQQGIDYGTQYRSAIFYHNDYQRKVALKSKQFFEDSDLWPHKYVTEISKLDVFYPAESYHDNFYSQNMEEFYCSQIITPKINKFKRIFTQWLKQ